jgi:MFS family permease
MAEVETRGLRRRLYGMAFVDEFGPVYAVYTLWFNDNGISASQISTMFLVWAATALLLEIPSGALADRVDRRTLLASAFAIRAVGISLWLLWPTFTGVLIGAGLWAIHSALASGTWEALIHDELTAVGDERHYPRVIARVSQFSNLGVAAGTMLGAGLLQLDASLQTLGWLTVAAHAGSITIVLMLPDVRWVARDGGDQQTSRSYAAWWATLREGVSAARRTPLLAKLIMVSAFQEGLFLIDEFVPLLTRERGGTDSSAPVIVLIVWVGLLLGGEISARRPDLASRALGLAVVAGSGVIALALVADGVWPLALIAVGYVSIEAAWIASDARLQQHAPTSTRATVTSVRGFGSATIAIAAFAIVGWLSDGDDPTPGLFVIVGATAVAGVFITRWVPPRKPS